MTSTRRAHSRSFTNGGRPDSRSYLIADFGSSDWRSNRLRPVPDRVRTLAEARRAARDARDWDEADRLREQIETAGWEVQDVPDGFRLVPRA